MGKRKLIDTITSKIPVVKQAKDVYEKVAPIGKFIFKKRPLFKIRQGTRRGNPPKHGLFNKKKKRKRKN